MNRNMTQEESVRAWNVLISDGSVKFLHRAKTGPYATSRGTREKDSTSYLGENTRVVGFGEKIVNSACISRLRF